MVTSETSTGLKQPAQTYTYNSLNQLNSLNSSNYSFDPAGDLITVPGLSYSYDTANQLISSNSNQKNTLTKFTFDARGNRTAQTPAKGSATLYSYDQANRLINFSSSSTSSTSYSYNGDGLRMSKKVGSAAVETFAWDVAEGLPLLLKDGTNSYIYGPDDLPIEQINSSTGEVLYYHHDQLGSTRLMTSSKGVLMASYSFDPYGNLTASNGTLKVKPNFLFAGQYTDSESGLQYLQARYYDPSTSQFLTHDPLAALSGSAYGYAANDPVNNNDPSGLWCAFGKNPNGSCRGSGVVNKVSKFVSDHNIGSFALIAAAGACIIVTFGACAVVTVAALGVKLLQDYGEAHCKVNAEFKNEAVSDVLLTGASLIPGAGIAAAKAGKFGFSEMELARSTEEKFNAGIGAIYTIPEDFHTIKHYL